MASESFISAIKAVTAGSLDLREIIARAGALSADDGWEMAVELYKVWIEFNKDSKLSSIARFNLAAILSEHGDAAGARAQLERAIETNPDFLPPYINLGLACERTGSVSDAIDRWQDVVRKLADVNEQSISYKVMALNHIGRVLESADRHPEAEDILRQSLMLKLDQHEVSSHFISLRLAQCKWPVVAPQDNLTRKVLMQGMSPLSMAAYTDDPLLQLACGAKYNLSYDPERVVAPARVQRSKKDSGRRRRIGYVSSDLREHAIGYLMAELFECHDRDKVEIFAYYCGPAAGDGIHARIKGAIEHWVDISRLSDQAAAERILADGIDILIDVNGYTRDARTRMLAMRPAPIIINWLGYPGSTGSPYHHYIIADDWIVPPENEIYYSESVLRLPCYQPNDRKRLVAPPTHTRADFSLPDDAFVFCCFNGPQKITKFHFARWMTILREVPGSVLWLLDGSEPSKRALIDHAVSLGMDPARLVFGCKLSNPYHLARYPLADLFLDTVPYGAHTTASDALWMGVPVLTLSGRSFASRVCGSLVRSAGLPELVCATPDEYVARAIELGRDRAKVEGYKARLREGRDRSVLFDTDLLARSLEGLFDKAWNDLLKGQRPQPDLSNMTAYLEAGSHDDHEQTELLALADYHGWYRERLARLHAIRPLAPDQRLWTVAEIKARER